MKTRSVSRPRPSRVTLPSFKPAALAVALALAAPRMACAGPTGPTAVNGQAQVTQPDAQTTLVRQDSDKAIINWQSFSIGSGQRVQFQQPGSNSVALNRVTTATPSEIHGALSANGKVFLVNPSGILFGAGASVDVGGLVASTLDIRDDDFLAGRYVFANGGNAGSVRNQGRLSAAEHGTIALLGAQVSNEGVVSAQLGTVGLAAGGRVSLDFAGDGLTRIVVDAAHINALVENGGAVLSDGGQVVMTAHALGSLANTVVRNSGTVQARSLVERNGRIVLDGGAEGKVEVAGRLDASGLENGRRGGAVKVLGRDLSLAAGSELDARGDAGGGTVLVGGAERGANPAFQHAASTAMDTDATIRADALGSGDGGTIVLWSDGPLAARGALSARGGAQAGNGGFIETSGQTIDIAGLAANASAARGKAGTWLLNPDDISIDAAEATAISTVLTSGTNATTTSTGSITVRSSITKTAAAPTNGVPAAETEATLTLNAAEDIIMYGGPTISSSSGKLHVNFNANANGKVNPGPNETRGFGAISLSNGSVIETNGGDIRFYGQSNSQSGSAIGSIFSILSGIELDHATLNTCADNCTTGGLIHMRAEGGRGGDPDSDNRPSGQLGISLVEPILRTGPGAILITGVGGMGSIEYDDERFPSGNGVNLYLRDNAYGGSISTTTGEILIVGTDGAVFTPASTPVEVSPYGASGVYAEIRGNQRISTTGGNIVVRGDTYGQAEEEFFPSGVNLRLNGSIVSGGSLNITGIAHGEASVGVDISGGFLPVEGDTSISALTAAGGMLLAGRGGTGPGLSLRDVTVTTTHGGQLSLAGESAGTSGVMLAGAVIGAPAMTGNIALRAASANTEASMLHVDEDAEATSIRTSGVVAIAPGGVNDSGELTARHDIPIAIGAGSESGFHVSFDELGLISTVPSRLVVGSAEHRAAIAIDESTLFNGDLSLQNDGGNGGIQLLSDINVSGTLTLSSGGTVAAADLEYGGPVIIAPRLLLHGATPEANFQLYFPANRVGQFAARFDRPKNPDSPANGDVNFRNTGALTIGNVNGMGYSVTDNAATTISTPNTTVAGDVLVNTSGNLTLGHDVSTLGSDITLVTGGLFLNPGSSQLLPGGGGRWQVYADTWVGEVRGSLAPSRPFPNYYGCTYGSDGCTARASGNHFVYRARPSLTISQDSASREYGDPDPLLGYSGIGLVNGDTLADATLGNYVSTASLRASPGTYRTDGTFSSPVGYDIVALPGSLGVTPATLLVSVDDKRKVYGGADPLPTATLTGFKLDDTAAVVSGLNFSTATGSGATVGTHSIAGADASAVNYRFVYEPGVLTVDPAALQVIIANASKTYGDADPPLSAGFAGLQYDDRADVVSGLVLSTVTGAAATAGTHPINGVGASAANYTFSYQPGTLAVQKAPLSVIADSKAKAYGAPDPALTATMTGLQYNDTSSVVRGLSLNTATGALAGAGTHPITASGASSDNYTLSFVPGVLEVAPAVLSYVATPTVQFQDLPPRPLGGTVTGFVYNDTPATATTGTLAFSSDAGLQSLPGAYAIQGSGLSAANYRLVQAFGNDTALTVLPSPALLRPAILRNVSFESSNVYEKNFGTPRLCVGTGPLGTGIVGGDANDMLALEWSRVRVSPNLSNCLGLGQRNSCSDF